MEVFRKWYFNTFERRQEGVLRSMTSGCCSRSQQMASFRIERAAVRHSSVLFRGTRELWALVTTFWRRYPLLTQSLLQPFRSGLVVSLDLHFVGGWQRKVGIVDCCEGHQVGSGYNRSQKVDLADEDENERRQKHNENREQWSLESIPLSRKYFVVLRWNTGLISAWKFRPQSPTCEICLYKISTFANHKTYECSNVAGWGGYFVRKKLADGTPCGILTTQSSFFTPRIEVSFATL